MPALGTWLPLNGGVLFCWHFSFFFLFGWVGGGFKGKPKKKPAFCGSHYLKTHAKSHFLWWIPAKSRFQRICVAFLVCGLSLLGKATSVVSLVISAEVGLPSGSGVRHFIVVWKHFAFLLVAV